MKHTNSLRIIKTSLGLRTWKFLPVVMAVMLFLQLGISVLLPVHVLAVDPIVTFPDANLQAAIRQAISKPTGDIYASDLADLNDLNLSSRSIINLSGLEYCAGLTNLDLGNNRISMTDSIDVEQGS